MSFPGVRPVFGGAAYGYGSFGSDDEMLQTYDILAAAGCDTIDTARIYGNSEERIGRTNGGARFTIDSKAPGGLVKGSATPEKIVQHAQESVKRLGIKQLNIYYIHAADCTVTLHGICQGFNTAYTLGLFQRFGLSNFSAAQILEAHAICTHNNWILPSVYQGNYNAFARLQETQILPTLRKLNMSFYAYSPMAGGLMTKTAEQIASRAPDAGRFSEGAPVSEQYGFLYGKPSMLRALTLWGKAAESAGLGRAELAYRWIVFDSALDASKGDAVVFGASRLGQIEQTLEWFKKGSVGPEALARINELWEGIKDDATLNNIDSNGDSAHLGKGSAP